MTTLLLWWLALFGVWPLANPGHDDLTSMLVLLDLVLHFGAGAALLDREIQRRATRRADSLIIDAAKERAYWWNRGAEHERRRWEP